MNTPILTFTLYCEFSDIYKVSCVLKHTLLDNMLEIYRKNRFPQ